MYLNATGPLGGTCGLIQPLHHGMAYKEAWSLFTASTCAFHEDALPVCQGLCSDDVAHDLMNGMGSHLPSKIGCIPGSGTQLDVRVVQGSVIQSP